MADESVNTNMLLLEIEALRQQVEQLKNEHVKVLAKQESTFQAFGKQNLIVNSFFSLATDIQIFVLDSSGHYQSFNESHSTFMFRQFQQKIYKGLNYFDQFQLYDIIQPIKSSFSKALAGECTKNQILLVRDGVKFKYSVYPYYSAEGISGAFIQKQNLSAASNPVTNVDAIFRNTLDHMLEGCQIIGFNWEYLYINPAAAVHNRRPAAELLGKRYMDMWPGVESTEVFKLIKDTIESRVSHHLINKFSFADGSDGWFDLSIQPLPQGVFILSIDVTEQKTAEEEFDKTYQRMLESQHTAKIGSWELSATTDKLWWSDEIYRIFELDKSVYSPDLKTNSAFIHPDDREMYQHEIQRVLNNNSELNTDLRIYTSTGKLKFCNSRARSVYDENGKLLRLYGTFSDITDRHLSEQKFRVSELRFRKIYEKGPFGMLLVNSELKILMANPHFCQMLGYSEDEILQMSLTDVSDSDDLKLDVPFIKQMFRGELGLYKTEKKYIHRNGTIIWGALTVTPNFDESGNFLYNLAIVEDISRRKIAEEEISRLNERISTATRVAGVGIWDWNILDNVLVWNEQMYSLYGVKSSEFSGAFEAWTKGLHPDDMEMAIEQSDKAVRGEADYDTEFRVVWPDDSIHFIKAKGEVFFNDEQMPVRMMGVNYDITSRKEAEIALFASKIQLETALKSMTDAVFITDSAGHFVHINDAFASFLKFSDKSECPSAQSDYNKLLELSNADGTITPVENWAVPRALRGEIATNAEYYLRRKDTGESWIGSYSFAPVRSENGTISGAVVVARDVTEAKKVEQTIKISEERYRDIFESAVIGIYRTTPEGKILLANDTLINMLGFNSFSELQNRNLEEVGYADISMRSVFRNRIEREGSVVGFESVWLTQSGEHLYVNENARAFFGLNGNVEYYEGTIEDITVRKNTEKALLESRDLLSNLACLVPGVIYQYRLYPDGRSAFPYSSPGMNTIYEVTPEQVQFDATPVFGMLHPDDYDDVVRKIQDSARTLETFYCEFRVKLPRQGLRWRWSQAHPQQMDDGSILWHGIISDITDRKLADEALRESETKLRSIFENSQDAIGVARKGELLMLNPAYLKLFGYKGENEMKGSLFLSFIARYDQGRIREFMDKCESGKESVLTFESEGIKKNGTEFPFEGRISTYTLNDEMFTIAILRDISERRRAEKKINELNNTLERRVIQRTSELESANKELESFSYSVSHDLRAPLRHINGYVEMLNSKFGENLPEKAQYFLETIKESTQQMGKLIDDLLKFSRTSRQEMHLTYADMNNIVKEVIAQLNTEIADREIEWEIASFPKVQADYPLLRQVVFNLLSNAVKFTRSVKNAQIKINYKLAPDECLFIISDNGAGFDMRYAHKLFGVFQRLHSTQDFEGTGIGLANVQRIILKHGGRVWAESELLKGATFYFTIPNIQEKQP